jgi:hypothetical protein
VADFRYRICIWNSKVRGIGAEILTSVGISGGGQEADNSFRVIYIDQPEPQGDFAAVPQVLSSTSKRLLLLASLVASPTEITR